MKRLLLLIALSALLSVPSFAAQPRYLLRAQGGMIFAYDLQTHQCRCTGTPLSSLPNEKDRILLENGIFLADRQSLASALEDFCS